MLKVGVLGYVVPLLFGFDATHEGDSGAPSSDASAVAALAGAGSAEQDASRDTGPAFLGLGTERSNMQVGCTATHHQSCSLQSRCLAMSMPNAAPDSISINPGYLAMGWALPILKVPTCHEMGGASSYLQEAQTTSRSVCVQAARNYHAMLAARALGRLAGLLQGNLASAPCQAAREALSALLTPALAAQLANPDPKPLLMHLNSSLLNPQARPTALVIISCPASLWLTNTSVEAINLLLMG